VRSVLVAVCPDRMCTEVIFSANHSSLTTQKLHFHNNVTIIVSAAQLSVIHGNFHSMFCEAISMLTPFFWSMTSALCFALDKARPDSCLSSLISFFSLTPLFPLFFVPSHLFVFHVFLADETLVVYHRVRTQCPAEKREKKASHGRRRGIQR